MQVVSLLLHHGADANARDNWNYTALHEAAIKGKTDVCIGTKTHSRSNSGGSTRTSKLLWSTEQEETGVVTSHLWYYFRQSQLPLKRKTGNQNCLGTFAVCVPFQTCILLRTCDGSSVLFIRPFNLSDIVGQNLGIHWQRSSFKCCWEAAAPESRSYARFIMIFYVSQTMTV